MPANLTPEFQKAQEWFRSASTDSEKILALEEMLRTIPKHKGTDHMQADIKRRLSKLRAAAESGKKRGGKHVDVFHVPRSGAGQVALVGVPNSGKSSIVGALSNAKVNIADYPFATGVPVPGMIHFEDVPIQLVDTPPVTADFAAPGQVGTYRGADLIGIVIDLSADVSEQWPVLVNYLESHRLLLDESTSELDANGNALGRKAFVICTKSDSARDGELEKLKELCDRDFELVMISTTTGEGLDEFVAKVFELLDIIRVYAKKPGKEADMKEPFTMRRGSTVKDLARDIHRELAEKLKSARCWGDSVHAGQNVHRTYELKDKDIIELHFS
jgi:ribosome-interacting GTPase 1